jgi:1-acyl-sn-glycerol-3-phosphate acyltransferase
LPIADRNIYITDLNRPRSVLSKLFLSPKFMFYPQLLWLVWRNSRKALRGFYDGDEWVKGSLDVLNALENVGVILKISGMDNIRRFDGPAVFISNHMSSLETFVLPCIIQPVKTVTFVVKKSLVEIPVFSHIIRSRDPVVVRRVNPREDLKKVLEDGAQKINEGRSIIIFPQSTRSNIFNPDDFNSLGIKLALRADVPVVPIALKTDVWGVGKHLKDFGPIDRNKRAYVTFGGHMHVEGRGTEEHKEIIRFIKENLEEWSKPDEKAFS